MDVHTNRNTLTTGFGPVLVKNLPAAVTSSVVYSRGASRTISPGLIVTLKPAE
jgi:hypothetical protein